MKLKYYIIIIYTRTKAVFCTAEKTEQSGAGQDRSGGQLGLSESKDGRCGTNKNFVKWSQHPPLDSRVPGH